MFARRTPSPGPGLQECPVCHDDYVVPVWWEGLEGVADDVARVYERDLERGMAEIAAALERDFAPG